MKQDLIRSHQSPWVYCSAVDPVSSLALSVIEQLSLRSDHN